MTSKKSWREIREQVFSDQDGKCAECPKIFPSHEDMHAHHAVFTKATLNYKKFMKIMDVPENIILVCWKCDHEHGYLSGYFKRCCAWSHKIEQGYDMDPWYEKMNEIATLKDHEKPVYLGNEEIREELRRNDDTR